MAGTLLAIFQTRLELFTVEMQEEVQRLFSYLILALVALFCVGVTLILAVFLVIVLFWDSYRISAICVMMLLFGLASIGIFASIRSSFRKKPKMLAFTRSELEKDIMRLKSETIARTEK